MNAHNCIKNELLHRYFARNLSRFKKVSHLKESAPVGKGVVIESKGFRDPT